MSDDGRHALTLIAFIGSVFSPYYAGARRNGVADPLEHCALNVALYGGTGKWALTERRRGAVRRTPDVLTLGPSALAWKDGVLTVRIDEVSAPLPSRIRGCVRLYPGSTLHQAVRLDVEGRHRWWPIAPCARVEVALDRPALAWRGAGYLDANAGSVPLEQSFRGWSWSRARLRDGTAVLYDVDRRKGDPLSLALAFDRNGGVAPFTPPPVAALPGTRWRIARAPRAAGAGPVAVVRTLEDTPFYARSLLSSRLLGERVTAMHESLSLERFSAAWVQMLLPFRMPRAWR